ncbi:MAG: hypothetical protein RR306_03075 [Clostridia bacterium]
MKKKFEEEILKNKKLEEKILENLKIRKSKRVFKKEGGENRSKRRQKRA